MRNFSKSTSYQKNLLKLQGLIRKTVPQCEERVLHGVVMYFYDSQPLIAYKRQRSNLIIQTLGRTPRERRMSMREYMTLLGNIKVRPQQPFPTAAIQSILTERKYTIDQNPGKNSLYAAISTNSKNGRPVPRHEKTAERIKKAEQRYPALQKLTKHPTLSPWVLPITVTIEVAAGLFALIVVLPWLISLIPDVTIPLPKIDLPTIDLPDWRLPFSLPDMPAWLSSLLYWFNKTLPIWIALFITLRVVRKKDKSQHPREKPSKC